MNVNVFLRSLNMISKYAMYQVSQLPLSCGLIFNKEKVEDVNSSNILSSNTD